MKVKTISILLNLIVLLTIQSSLAQAPQKMTYQAVIRGLGNVAVANTTVGMQISILQGSAIGIPVYVETQTPMTNAVGLVTLEIGTGAVVSGVFANINWSTGLYWIKTETDPLGGVAYSISGTSQFLSVPYAFFAGSTSDTTDAWITTGNSNTIDGTHFIGTTDSIPFTIKVNNKVSGRIDHIKKNSFWGYRAGLSNTSGFNNSAFGNNSLLSNIIGDDNTALGFGADVALGDLINATAIGAHAFVADSNSMVLGSINGINGATSNVHVGIGTTTPENTLSIGLTSQFQVNDTGNIVKLNKIPTNFPSVQGAVNTFLRNDGNGNLTWVPVTVIIPFANKPDGSLNSPSGKESNTIAYNQFINPLIKGMQDQQMELENQQKINKQLNEKIESLQKQVEEMKLLISKFK
ncbi:MAG: hypothetical protein ABI761_04300 [Saprospiraceae bacterium]